MEVNKEVETKTKYNKRNWKDYLKEEKILVEYQIKVRIILNLKYLNMEEPKIIIISYNKFEENKIKIEND